MITLSCGIMKDNRINTAGTRIKYKLECETKRVCFTFRLRSDARQPSCQLDFCCWVFIPYFKTVKIIWRCSCKSDEWEISSLNIAQTGTVTCDRAPCSPKIARADQQWSSPTCEIVQPGASREEPLRPNVSLNLSVHCFSQFLTTALRNSTTKEIKIRI